MLFKKNQPAPTKIHFSVNHCSAGWEIYLVKNKTDATPVIPSIPKPEISIHYQPELDTELAEVTTCFGNTKVVMKASVFSYETRVLGMELRGYDPNNRWVVSFQEWDNCIIVAPDGMNQSFEGERFYYHCSAENITFTNKDQTVMEMYPAFIPNRPGAIQIKGWVCESYLRYLPYLSGILGYTHLT